MDDNILDKIFKEKQFDIEMPRLGHEGRFLGKLVTSNAGKRTKNKSLGTRWFSIAATIVLAVSILMFIGKNNTEQLRLADISPSMAKTESIFMASLQKELNELDSREMPEHQEVIVDALFQIKVLEEDFNQLVVALNEEPNNELILSAMILNFQSRIDILKDTKETIKFLKNKNINTI